MENLSDCFQPCLDMSSADTIVLVGFCCGFYILDLLDDAEIAYTLDILNRIRHMHFQCDYQKQAGMHIKAAASKS